MAVNRAYPVAHSDPIIHCDGVEFFGHATGGFNLLGNQFAEIAQVHVPGTNWVKELTTAIIGLPKSASVIPVARHNARAPAILRPCGGGGTVLRHALLLPSVLNGTVRAVPFLITYLPDPTSPIYLLFHR